MTTTIRSIVSLLIMTPILAGCPGGDSDSATPTPAQGTATSAPSTALVEDGLARIEEGGMSEGAAPTTEAILSPERQKLINDYQARHDRMLSDTRIFNQKIESYDIPEIKKRLGWVEQKLQDVAEHLTHIPSATDEELQSIQQTIDTRFIEIENLFTDIRNSGYWKSVPPPGVKPDGP